MHEKQHLESFEGENFYLQGFKGTKIKSVTYTGPDVNTDEITTILPEETFQPAPTSTEESPFIVVSFGSALIIIMVYKIYVKKKIKL